VATEPLFPSERRMRDLLAMYRQAQRTIIAQIREALTAQNQFAASQRRAQLASVLRTLDQLGIETEPLAREIVANVYEESGDHITKELKKLGVTGPPTTEFAGVSHESVAALQESIVGRLADARTTIGRQAADVFATQQRRTAMLSLLGAEGSPRKASKQLQQQLLARGKTAFVDRAGRQWGLEQYANMATRTVIREAVTQGAIARMASHGVNLARVSSHASSCHICAPWQGRLVSLDGSEGSLLGEAASDLGALPNGGPPFHPNCRHSLMPVVGELEEMRQAKSTATDSHESFNPQNTTSPAGAHQAIHTAVDAIGKVHEVPSAVRSIEFRKMAPGIPYKVRAQHVRYNQGGGHIEVRGSSNALTVVHELGHAADHRLFGQGHSGPDLGTAGWDMIAGTSGDARFKDWWDAVTSSQAVADITADPTLPGTYKKYLTLSKELFARSYAQWVAVRSGDAHLQQLVQNVLDNLTGSEIASQWKEADFEPIARELDKLFAGFQ
jgi:hypothetical protein